MLTLDADLNGRVHVHTSAHTVEDQSGHEISAMFTSHASVSAKYGLKKAQRSIEVENSTTEATAESLLQAEGQSVSVSFVS